MTPILQICEYGVLPTANVPYRAFIDPPTTEYSRADSEQCHGLLELGCQVIPKLDEIKLVLVTELGKLRGPTFRAHRPPVYPPPSPPPNPPPTARLPTALTGLHGG